MSFSSLRTLVTGGTGFIGSHLVPELVARGARVTVVDDLSTGRRENLAPVLSEIELVSCALGEYLATHALARGEYDIVFHLAANAYVPPSVENPRFDFQANLVNTFSLLDALRLLPRRPRLINISSAAVYGSPIRLPIAEDAPLDPISPYGVSKLAGERYAAVFARLYGVPVTSLRFTSVYGPRQHKQVVYDFLVKLRQNPHHVTMFGDGSQLRDFTYVSDIVNAILLVAERAPAQGEALNVATGAPCTIRELLATWCHVLGVNPDIEYTGSVRAGDAERWDVDITAVRTLGYVPQVSLAAGLARVRDWYDASAHE